MIQSRAIAAYSMSSDLAVKYSGQIVDMHHPYPPSIANLQSQVEEVLGLTSSSSSDTSNPSTERGEQRGGGFNHVMLNRYEDGSIYIGRHSDTKENNVRTFRMLLDFVTSQ